MYNTNLFLMQTHFSNFAGTARGAALFIPALKNRAFRAIWVNSVDGTAMRFGIFSVVDHYPAEIESSVVTFYQELLQQAQKADELRQTGRQTADKR